MSHDSRSDTLLCVLCARALQRKGEGFPSTAEEIAAFKAAHSISAEDMARFRVLAQRMVDVALAEADKDTPQISILPRRLLTNTPEDAQGFRYAARKAQGANISDDLKKVIDHLIDEKRKRRDGETGNGQNA
ncbi:MAG TPA: hypothetical protein PK280_05830 [Planctomycetota bacterium]|nr:hypothetical protein [Planctomycetota bacterium]